MKTVSDQIKDLENTRAAKAAQAEAVMQKSMAEGRSTEADEAEEFDALTDEIKQIDQDITRLRKLEALNAQKAAPVVATSSKSASESRSTGPTIIVKGHDVEEKFAGQNYTRMVIAK